MLKFPLDDNLTPLEKWLRLKELQSVIKLQLNALDDEIKELADKDETEGKVKVVKKSTIKYKDSIIKFLDNKELLDLVRSDDIDKLKIQQLLDAGVIKEDELEEHIIRKDTSYLKKSK